MSRPPIGHADQIVFRWSDYSLTGRKGVGPVAASIGATELARWEDLLQPYIWATDRDLPAQQSDLVHRIHGNHAVVLHRLCVADPHGRPGSTLTHCLIGSPDELTPATAVGLHNWPGWVTDPDHLPTDGRLDPVSGAQLIGHGENGLRRIRQMLAVDRPVELPRLFAALLDDPSARLVVIDPSVSAILLIGALVEMSAVLLAGTMTFSTREEKELHAKGLRIIVVDGRLAAQAQQAGYRRVPPGQAELPFDQLAGQLVETYLVEGLARLEELRNTPLPQTRSEVLHWVERIQRAPGVLGSIGGLLRRAAGNTTRPEEIGYLTSRAGQDAIRTALDRALTAQLTEWTGGRSRDLVRTGVVPLIHEELLVRLFRDVRALDRDKPVAALVAAGVDHQRVLTAMRQAWERLHKEHRPSSSAVDLVRTATSLGLTSDELRPVADDMFGTYPIGELLRAAAMYSSIDPQVTRMLMDALIRRRRRRQDAKEATRVLEDYAWFVPVVTALEPDDEPQAVELFLELLLLATGGAPIKSADQIRRILTEAHRPTIAFQVAVFRAAESDAAQFIRDLLLVQFLEDRGFVAPAEQQDQPNSGSQRWWSWRHGTAQAAGRPEPAPDPSAAPQTGPTHSTGVWDKPPPGATPRSHPETEM
ncbi:hypothetical protein ACQP2E_20795 [Actinoplanes sp. CA-015351]|uniref:hypothetical protein n=1 Tax=Actinoplanes sp. CA-015351 TaxID=3239897 RepID=UPI003D9952D9